MKIIGVGAAVQKLTQLEAAGQKNLARAVTRAAMLTVTDVRANASGRPGPRAPTGNFRRSITHMPARNEGTSVKAYVGSNAVQARRLELGFYGPDSLGRHYNQPPYPWLRPAIPKAAAHLRNEVARGIQP